MVHGAEGAAVHGGNVGRRTNDNRGAAAWCRLGLSRPGGDFRMPHRAGMHRDNGDFSWLVHEFVKVGVLVSWTGAVLRPQWRRAIG